MDGSQEAILGTSVNASSIVDQYLGGLFNRCVDALSRARNNCSEYLSAHGGGTAIVEREARRAAEFVQKKCGEVVEFVKIKYNEQAKDENFSLMTTTVVILKIIAALIMLACSKAIKILCEIIEEAKDLATKLKVDVDADFSDEDTGSFLPDDDFGSNAANDEPAAPDDEADATAKVKQDDEDANVRVDAEPNPAELEADDQL
jgi:hypothetical protein